jgi:hypothetical protein
LRVLFQECLYQQVKIIKKMTHFDSTQHLNIIPNVNTQKFYRPRTMKVFLSLALIVFMAQGCQQSGLSRSQAYHIETGPYIAGSVADYHQGFKNSVAGYAVFTVGFNRLQGHDDKGSEADGTLVVKSLVDCDSELSF